MGFIKDKVSNLIDEFKFHKEFDKDKRIIQVQVVKGNRKIVKAINDSSNDVFIFFGKAKEVFNNDIIIDFRNNKYIVNEVEENCKIPLLIDEESFEVDVVKVHYAKFEHDTESIFDIVTQKFNVNSTINISISEIKDSTINSIGAITNSINQMQDYETTWRKIKHDLNWRFEYKEYDHFISNIDDAIKNNNPNIINQKDKDNAVKLLGGFLGEFLGTFIGSLISCLNKS